MTEATTRHDAGWLSREEMDAARERLPILYVDAVPVRVDDHGVVTKVGLLLRVGGDGQIKRSLVSGRVLYHERVSAVAVRELANASRRVDNPTLLAALPDTGIAVDDVVEALDAGRGDR
jgi:hypothetical protein